MKLKNSAREFFSADEIRILTERSDLAGLRAIALAWITIAAAFSLAALFPNPVTILLAVLILGTRQLTLAIIMHEGAHGTLMNTRAANETLSQWLGAAPILQNMYLYRRHHMQHHKATGTKDDPDLRLAHGFPVSRASMCRKLLRDVSGLTGLKTLLGSVLMLLGWWRYDVSGVAERADLRGLSGREIITGAVRGIGPALLSNALLLTLFVVLDQAWLYLLWVAAYVSVYPLVLRIRSIAEHAMTTDPQDALNNSRTTRTRWWEALAFVPLNVNYHLEHHMLAAVPFFNLPVMHRMLEEKGVFAESDAAVVEGYGEILRMASAG